MPHFSYGPERNAPRTAHLPAPERAPRHKRRRFRMRTRVTAHFAVVQSVPQYVLQSIASSRKPIVTSTGSARPARRTAASPAPSSSTAAAAVATLAPAPDPGAPAQHKTRGRGREDKDQPLFEDIRYLGRLLGDVVREQEGDAVFDVVETIRQNAVKFRREDDSRAAEALDEQLRALTPEQTVSVVRAFSYFSHLANIAEDRHHNRRRRIHALAGSAPQAGTAAHALPPLAP